MTNPGDPAFLGKPQIIYVPKPPADCDIQFGLTKREYFAAMVIQGQLASMTNAEVVRAWKGSENPEAWCARSALAFADALIAELSK